MVGITRTASMRLSPGMERAKDLLAGGPYGRKAIQEKDVPFIEKLPLSLKNIVANTYSIPRTFFGIHGDLLIVVSALLDIV